MAFSRRREVGLLVLVFAILAVGYFVVWQKYLAVWPHIAGFDAHLLIIVPASMGVAWLLLSWALTARRCRETLVIPIVALLIGLSLLFLLRLAGGEEVMGLQRNHPDLGAKFFSLFKHQFYAFWLGWAVLMGMVLCWKDYRALARYKYLLAAIAVVMLVVTTAVGKATNDQTITLHLGPIVFQPHDPVKLLMVIFLAAYLVEKRELITHAAGRYGLLTLMDLRYMGPLLALWLMVMAIVFIHKDLGAAALLFGSFLATLYLGTGRKNYVFIGIALFAVGMVLAYMKVERVQTRVAIWQNPWRQYTAIEHGKPVQIDLPNGKGYQICQALMALGNGRVIGAGLAGGYPESIPAVETDMIYAAISEDLGLLGAVVLVGLFLVLIARMFRVALQTEDPFGQLLVAGLAATMAVQTFVILGGTVKLIPLTGVPLPFMSYGGTSLVINCALLGIVLKVGEDSKAQIAHTS